MSEFQEEKPKKVLVIRPDNLGDVVFFSGALRHIRSYYKFAKITLCVKRYVQNYLELCPYIDEIICWEDMLYNLTEYPTINWLPKFRGRWRLQLWLRNISRQFLRLRYYTDILIVPIRSPRPSMHTIAQIIPAKEKIAIGGDFANQTPAENQAAKNIYTRRLRLSPKRREDHELNVTNEFLAFLGLNLNRDDLWPEIWNDKDDRVWAVRHIPSASNGVVTLGIAPGVASYPHKVLPASWYAETIGSLSAQTFQVIILGSHAEIETCNEVSRAVARCPNVVLTKNYAGRTTIRQLIESLRRCDIIVSQETAALHLAVALHKPTVGIMGGGHYGRFYPWGDPKINRVANKNMDCYLCNWHCKYALLRCIQEIPYKRAQEEIKLLLDN